MPLLPTQLKGTTAVLDMFLHKERKHIMLMTGDRLSKPQLGTKSKGKEKGKKRKREMVNGMKPYVGEDGMKKWLARCKKEEEKVKERERAKAMEDERAEEEVRKKQQGGNMRRNSRLLHPHPQLLSLN